MEIIELWREEGWEGKYTFLDLFEAYKTSSLERAEKEDPRQNKQVRIRIEEEKREERMFARGEEYKGQG
ncbi:hypothetical protein Tco_0032635 [Tanacetum coccineum]